jgi:MATE family multidrug resistance protein
MILSNISTPLLGLVDTIVMGHLDSEHYLAAVAIGGLIFGFVFWGFGFLRMGTTGLSAQALGKHDRLEMNGVLVRALVLAWVISIVLLFIQAEIAHISFWIIESSARVEQNAKLYFDIRIWSTPATLSLYVLMGWFLGQQWVKIPFFIVLLTNLINISLDILFVYHFKMQVGGVALASLIAEYIGLVAALLIAIKTIRQEKMQWPWRDIFCLHKFKAMLLINSHIFLRTWCLIFTFAFFTAQGAKMGDMVLAANAVLLNFQSFMAYALDGFAHAAEAMVGKAVGAKNKIAYKQAVLTAGLWSAIIAIIFSMSYKFFGHDIVNVLTGLEKVREVAYLYLPWLVAMPLISFVCYLLDGVFIGAMITMQMRNTMIFSLFCVFLPVWYFTQTIGNTGLWLAMSAFMLARGVSMAFVFSRVRFNIK